MCGFCTHVVYYNKQALAHWQLATLQLIGNGRCVTRTLYCTIALLTRNLSCTVTVVFQCAVTAHLLFTTSRPWPPSLGWLLCQLATLQLQVVAQYYDVILASIELRLLVEEVFN